MRLGVNLTPIQKAQVAKRELRKNAERRFYVYHGESFEFTFAGDTKSSTVVHGDAIALSQADADVFRKLGRKLADTESKDEKKELGATDDFASDVETVERAIVEDDYTLAAKLARKLGLELDNQLKPTVFTALLEWLDTQKG